MEDIQIIELYFNRDEAAITETASKYGAFCHGIAFNILSNHADAEECVNDTTFRHGTLSRRFGRTDLEHGWAEWYAILPSTSGTKITAKSAMPVWSSF